MGKGDKKTKRGKIVIGSFGVRRARKKKDAIVASPKITSPEQSEEIEEQMVSAVKPAPKKTVKKPAEQVPAEEKTKTPRVKKKSATDETTVLPEGNKED